MYSSQYLNRVVSRSHFRSPLWPSDPSLTQVLLKFVVSKEFFAAAPVVEYTGSAGRIVLERVAKLADDVSRRRECSLAVDGSSYINISDS
jgi:hypothetical protein